MKNEGRHRFILLFSALLVLIGLITFAGVVSANTHFGHRGSMQRLDEGEIIDGPAVFTGTNISIDGAIEGTAFAIGEDIRVNGDINGSLFALGQRLFIAGEVTGNIYGAAEIVVMNGQNESEVFLAGESVVIEEQAEIGRDLFAAGINIRVEGEVPRHLYAAGESVLLTHSIGGDVFAAIEQLTLTDDAVIEGNLSYDSPNEAQIPTGATVAGQADWTETDSWNVRRTMHRTMSTQTRWLLRFLWVVGNILSALLVWLIFKLISRDFWVDTIWPIADQPLKTLGTGLLLLLLTPLVAGLLMITLIGIPIGGILLLLYGISLYLSKIILALFIGASLFRLFNRTEGNNEFLLVLSGLIILEILLVISVLNAITALVIAVTGLGALLLSRRNGLPETSKAVR
ncbi:bactofilin family protein [Alkalibacterium sp.]|nr:MAG: hypothetical protein EA249_07310 [Alkalibacterium sp.]